MANIVVLDWLAENKLRAFPLKHKTNKEANSGYVIQNGLLLDLKLVYTAIQTNIRLLSITKDNSSAVFLFTGGVSFNVALPLAARYHRVGSSLLVVGEVVADIPNGTHTFSQAAVDPQCITQLYGKWRGVTSLTFGGNTPLTGEVELLEGLQTKVVSLSSSSLAIGASNLYGTPLACDSFSDAPADCSTIISNISGIFPDGNNVFYLLAGDGMVVYDDPDNHRIYVGFAFTSADDVCKPIQPNPIA